VIFRALWRAVALVWVVGCSCLRLMLFRLSGPMDLESRALWMQSICKRVLSAMGIPVRVTGRPPDRGLLVSNHLSYLDILAYGAVLPCFFVSKAEIARWPFFGALARAGGTIFLNRARRASTEQVAATISQRLPLRVPILFFPEGTSSDGAHVMAFHPRFFEPAVVASAPVTAAAVRYIPQGGSQERELCWYGDAAFLPHLWRTLCSPKFNIEVSFGQPKIYPNRRIASSTAHAEIAAMRKAAAHLPQ